LRLSLFSNGFIAQELEELHKEEQALRRICEMIGQEDFGERVFQKVFNDDIKRLLSMEDMWKDRKPPKPFIFTEVMKEADTTEEGNLDTNLWSLKRNTQVFINRLL
jgi:ubiquitin-like 1-activating enzyme E1 B